ncbi:MAG: RNA polymerase sigma factor [Caldilineaceae bacterium]
MNNTFDPTPSDEATFLARLKQGDEQAWNWLTQKHGTKLYEFFLHALSDQEIAADLVSETLLAAVRNIHDFDGKVTLTAFMYGIAIGKLQEYYQRFFKTQTMPNAWQIQAFDPATLNFAEIWEQLPETYHQVLILRYHVGLGIDEIAKLLGKNYTATEKLLGSARRHLETLFKKSDRVATPKLSPWKSAIAMLEEQKVTCQGLGMQPESQIFAGAIDTLKSLNAVLPRPAPRRQGTIYPQSPHSERKM